MINVAAIFFVACTDASKQPEIAKTVETVKATDDTIIYYDPPATLIPGATIETGTINPLELVEYAKTLIGTSYCYGSTDKAKGFDCSGFVTHVFNHFGIAVPRSSVDFTNVGKEIDYKQAGPGDLILFTGTDSTIRVVGHMGIVISDLSDTLQFIHSSSGKARGVVISPLERYYKSRFVKVIRIFPERFYE
jgi:cell wall-associated NlpC family hydrolase